MWLQNVKSHLADLEQGNTQVRRAPPLSVAMIIALELSVNAVGYSTFFKGIAWVILLCTWACLRLSDLEGLDPTRLQLSSRGLRGVLTRTKTTGPGKQVKETPIFVARRISLTGVDWLQYGFELWSDLNLKGRDYFAPSADHKLENFVGKFASTEKVAAYVRHVLMNLATPVKGRYDGWKLREEISMFDGVTVMHWTGHSMRHVIPTIAAAIDIGKEQRDYVGRWHINMHQSVDYIHTSRQIVQKVQESVNRAICEGDPSYDESELMEEYACFLQVKGRRPSDWMRQHSVWRRVDGSYQIGGKWPTIDPEILEEEAFGEGQVENVEAGDVEEVNPEATDAPYFVTISRHSGFRRLHKAGCCSTLPWTCYKVEYLARVTEGVADAVCKTCQRACGKEVEIEDSSSSGSSSSTDAPHDEARVEDLNEPVGLNEFAN